MLEDLKQLVMEQAKAKGFGTKPEEVNVPEKILLMATEVWEAREVYELLKDFYEAYDKFPGIFYRRNPDFKRNEFRDHLKGRFNEEIGDILQRDLHLGGIFEVDFSKPDIPSEYQKYLNRYCEDKSLHEVHSLIMHCSDSYRHKKMDDFYIRIQQIADHCVSIANDYKFDIEEVVKKKIEINKNRIWSTKDLNEQLSS